MKQRAWILAVAATCVFSVATGDQWFPATPSTYSSSGGEYRLTVFPRDLAGPLPYFQDKVQGKPQPGQSPVGPASCEATLEVLENNAYRLVWRKPLINDVAPVSVLVSDTTGAFVTFDNWHGTGWGNDAIVVYDERGKLVRQFALTDLISKSHFDSLPHSVSSIQWGGEHWIDSDKELLHLEIIPMGADVNALRARDAEYEEILVRMRDGAVLAKAK